MQTINQHRLIETIYCQSNLQEAVIFFAIPFDIAIRVNNYREFRSVWSNDLGNKKADYFKEDITLSYLERGEKRVLTWIDLSSRELRLAG